jgi:hypothetical protein
MNSRVAPAPIRTKGSVRQELQNFVSQLLVQIVYMCCKSRARRVFLILEQSLEFRANIRMNVSVS